MFQSILNKLSEQSSVNLSRVNPCIVIRWWFLRGLGLVYLSAFWSMATQIEGLIGANGILPLQEQLAHIAQALPQEKQWYFPTLFWFDASNMALKSVCFAGIAAACLITFNIFTRAALIACFVGYLSITTAGQDFTSFQCYFFAGKRFSGHFIDLEFPGYLIFIPLADRPFHVHGRRGENRQR
jgi:hypothetical protein